VKDRKKDAAVSEKDASVVLGTGEINFSELLKVAGKQGMDYFIVEQERYDNTTPLEAAKADANYMKNLRV
jgi:sugar phosphate isomerase/epimerase